MGERPEAKVAGLVVGTLRRAVYKLLILQLLVVLLVALIAGGGFGGKAFLSALLGGLAWWLPNAWYARRVFANMSPRAGEAITRAFVWGEFMKLALSAVLVVVFIKLFSIEFGAFLSGYISALGAGWLGFLVLGGSKKQ